MTSQRISIVVILVAVGVIVFCAILSQGRPSTSATPIANQDASDRVDSQLRNQAAPAPAQLVAPEHERQGDGGYITLTVNDPSGLPARGVRAYDASVAKWGRFLKSPRTLATTDDSGSLRIPAALGLNRVLLHGRDVEPQLHEINAAAKDPVVEMKAASRISLRIVNEAGVPLPGFAVFASEMNMYHGYEDDANEEIVPMPGYKGIRKAIADANGVVELADLRHVRDGVVVYLYPVAPCVFLKTNVVKASSDEQVVPVRKVSVKHVAEIAEGAILASACAVASDGVYSVRETVQNPFVAIGHNGEASVVLSVGDTRRYVGYSATLGIVAVDNGSIVEDAQSRYSFTFIAQEGCPPFMMIEVSQHPQRLYYELRQGQSMILPRGEYRVLDPSGSIAQQAVIKIPDHHALLLKSRQRVFKVKLDVKCEDGMIPSYVLVNAANEKQKVCRADATIWLHDGVVQVASEGYGRATVHVRSDREPPTQLNVVLPCNRDWITDLPLGAECERIAEKIGIMLIETRLDPVRLAEVQERDQAIEAEVSASMGSLYGLLDKAIVGQEPHEVFKDEGRFYKRQVELGDPALRDDLGNSVAYWAVDAGEHGWTGYIYNLRVDGLVSRSDWRERAARYRRSIQDRSDWRERRKLILDGIIRAGGVAK